MSRWIALTTLAAALASSPPTLAVETDAEAINADSEEPVYHTVESGETIWAIADRYGSSAASVLRANEIENPSKIWVGTRLRIPLPADADSSLRIERTVDANDPGAVDAAALIDRCEAELRAARFEQALASASGARARIDARNDVADNPDRVRLEVASATAYVALGQNDAALESFERALIADPNLELDTSLTSPKVLAVFRAARSHAPRRR
jgi:LysM repeat protein